MGLVQNFEQYFAVATRGGGGGGGGRGGGGPQNKNFAPQTAHNTAQYAKFFPLRQFEDVAR